jgi:hypothetical protein
VKGKECSHHNIGDLEEVLEKLNIKMNDTIKKSKLGICILLEYELRRYDIERLNGKRWFFNAIEDMKKKFVFK